MSEPSFDDLADTVSANFRQMKTTALRMEQLQITVNCAVALMFICLALLMFTLYSKARR